MPYPARPLEDRFHEKYVPEPNTGCWLWTGAVNGGGYGLLRKGKEPVQVRAHRVSFEIYHRPLASGEYVLHRCDTPPCVNPDHLFAGTQADNMADMVMKGRSGYRYSIKLTENKVRQIKYMLDSGFTPKMIEGSFGVSKATVSLIRNGKIWKHV